MQSRTSVRLHEWLPGVGGLLTRSVAHSTFSLMVLGWGCGLAIGMGALVAYTNSAGEFDAAPTRLTIESLPPFGKHTLLMFVHPKCPCSRASIAELARLMSRCGQRIDARVYFFQPDSQPEDWAKTDLWQSAQRTPNVNVAVDPNGRLAAAYGARTSGQALLYDAQGVLCFQGGITAGRGHEGDNAGRSAVENLIEGRGHGPTALPVFGCTIAGSCKRGVMQGDHEILSTLRSEQDQTLSIRGRR